jgi:hypothetical protein
MAFNGYFIQINLTCYGHERKDTHGKPPLLNLREAEGEASNRVYCYSLIWDEIVL